MLKIPINNTAFVQILVVWVKGKKETTARAYPYLNGYLNFMDRTLYFLKMGVYAISQETNAPTFSQLQQDENPCWTVVDDMLYKSCNINDSPITDLDFEVIHHPVVGFVELQNC